jgi:hypothetical protein
MKSVDSTRVYSCDELGACQMRTPRCNGCTVVTHVHPQPRQPIRFAPGVIDAGARRSHFEYLTTRRAVSALEFIKGVAKSGAALIVLVVLLGFTTEYGRMAMRALGFLGA